jgi:hypothetical protein
MAFQLFTRCVGGSASGGVGRGERRRHIGRGLGARRHQLRRGARAATASPGRRGAGYCRSAVISAWLIEIRGAFVGCLCLCLGISLIAGLSRSGFH